MTRPFALTTRRPRAGALAALIPAALLLPVCARAQSAPAASAPGFTETVSVTSTRLSGEPEPAREVPAHVTVITREQIARSGARTLQELLAREAGVVVYDQVGNGVETTFDLRGFSGGSGTAVFLDGARLNDPRNNSVSLDMVPIDAVDRIEIIRGSASALAGGGSEAGVIQIVTRAGGDGGALSAAGGSFGTQQYRGSFGWRSQARGTNTGGAMTGADFFLSLSRDDSDGFRENSGGALDRYAATLGYGFGEAGRLSLTLARSDAALDAPGALTVAELAHDREQSPFNQLDGSDRTKDLASLNWRGPLGGGFSLAVNAYTRRDETSSLTTGRSAAAFGGFFLEEDSSTDGGVIQATHSVRRGNMVNETSFGVEYARGDVDARAVSTPGSDPGDVDGGFAAADNSASRRTKAWFVSEKWTPLPKWTFSAGVRSDDDRIEFDDPFSVPAIHDERSFSERSTRGGGAWNPSPKFGLYASYGESFLPPTIEDLFAFQGFGSNPGLDPEDARSREAGLRGDWSLGSREGGWNASFFRIDTENEIVFDPTPVPGNPFGQSVNAGRTRREGIELSWTGSLTQSLSGFAHVTWTDAEFQNGPDRGRRVPLVPRERVSLGVDWALPAGFSISADALYVGEQVLDNDAPNAQPRLGSYAVVNLRARALVLGKSLRARPGETLRGIHVFAEVRNLLDKEYETRGIYAFDFSTFTNEIFLTPAPGRRLLGGLEWTF